MLNNSTNNNGFKPPNLAPAGPKKLAVIAPSPVKPIAPKDNSTKPPGNESTSSHPTAMISNNSLTTQPGQVPQNLISSSQLQHQQQQYIMQQQFQQQFHAYQAQQLQQRQLQQQQQQQQQHQQQGPIYMNNINSGNIRMPIANQQQKNTPAQAATGTSPNVNQQNLTSQLIMAALKQQQQQQQQQHVTTATANLNTPARDGYQQIMPTQQLLQYLATVNNSTVQQTKNQTEQKDSIPNNKKPIVSAPINKAPPAIFPKPGKPDKPANTSITPQPQPLKPKPANQPMVQQPQFSNKNQMTASGMAPTIYQASTNEKGQIVFSAVEPSAATSAALAAYQKQQLQQKQLQQTMANTNQQALKNVAPIPFGLQNTNLPSDPSQRLSKASTTIGVAPKAANPVKTKETEKITDSLKQQEILKQRLHQEEQKYLKLQAKLNMLQSNSQDSKQTNSKESASTKSPDLDGSSILKNLVSNEINKISTKTVKNTDSMEIDSNTSNVENTQSSLSNTTLGTKQTPGNAPSRSSLGSGSGSAKRRGRPRLYEIDPLTQKSIKSKPLAMKIPPQPKQPTNETNTKNNEENCQIVFQPNVQSPDKLPIANDSNHVSKEISSPTSSSMSFTTAHQNEEKNEEELIVDVACENVSMSSDESCSLESESGSDSESDAQLQESQCIIKPKYIQPKQLENIISIQKAIRSSIDDTIEDVINRNNVSSNSDKENAANKSTREVTTNVAVNNNPDKNEELFSTIRKQNSASPTSPFSASMSTNSSKSSRSVSPSSITSSAKKRNNNNLIENVKNINKIPVGAEDNSIIITHIIEGFVIKESGQPFPVKQNTETIKRDDHEKKLERCEEEIKARLEELHASRKKYMEELEKSYVPPVTPKEQTPISPTGNAENKSPGELMPPTNHGSFQIDKVHHTPNINHLEDATNKACLNASNSQLNRSCNNCTPDKMNLSIGQNANHNSTMLNFNSPKNKQLNQSASQLNLSKVNEGEIPPGDPVEWSDEDVYQFVKIVAGVSYAEIFKLQEVDGTALSLIRDDHLVNAMHIKLGPALKIMSKFNEIRSRFNSSMMA